jgi:riboflavin kinase/FMN adenylyltransferase
VALGSFDGVHLGHRQLIDHGRNLATELGGPLAVLTFDPLPAQLIYPDFTYVLTPLAEKTRLLAELGVDLVHVVRFDDVTRNLTPEEVVSRHIVAELNPAAVIVGHDHRFGRRGRGDTALLQKLLDEAGVRLDVVPEFILLGAPVRSTRIREHLLLGAVARAAELLGRYYTLSGTVVSGTGTGRKLGFPTINLRPHERETLVPADGVYVARVDTLGHRHDAVLNIGHRPTFGGENRTIEAHLLDFAGPRQPDAAVVSLIDRIRPERRFAGPAELSHQIAADVAAARDFLVRLQP